MGIALVLAMFSNAHGVTVYSESVNGDLSNSGLNPTGIALGLGSNDIFGTTGQNAGVSDRDYFTLTVPANFIITQLIEAAGTRLRPILMTSAATVFGHLPLVFATGPGAGARNSIGITLVSGMIIGTFFTLFVVPSIYMLVARTRVAVASPVRTREKRIPELAEAV
jgi:hypothetical protein